MSVAAGKDGSVKIGSDTMIEVQSWDLDGSTDLADSASLGDDWKEKTPTLNEWSATIEVNWDMSDTAQVAVQNAWLNQTSVSPKLYTNAANYYSGTAYISSLNVGDPVDGLVTASMELTGSGACTYA